MKDIKDVLLYLDSFDENNMFDFDHNNKLYYVSEVLKVIMYDRIEKYDLDYCEDDILDLFDLTVKITDMIILKKPNVLQEIKKMYNSILQYDSIEYDDDDEWNILSEDSDTGEIIGFRNMYFTILKNTLTQIRVIIFSIHTYICMSIHIITHILVSIISDIRTKIRCCIITLIQI